ncbi:hypothetical protein Gpo141_00014245, partial [Globisporangium polare]
MEPSPRTDGSFWAKLARRWEALHVERQGCYSVERLFASQHYATPTSFARATTVLLLTPLPCLASVVVADLIPLQPPSLGIARSHTFWLRAHLGRLGPLLKANRVLQRQFTKFTLVFGFQATFAYPALTFLFKRLSGFAQVAFAATRDEALGEEPHGQRKVRAAIERFDASILETLDGERAIVWQQMDLSKAAIFLLENDSKILDEQTTRLRSHESRRILPSNLTAESRIQPSEAVSALNSTGDHHLSAEEKRVILDLDNETRVRFVQHVLPLLYWTELLLLVEFTEVVIPVVYSAYLIVAFQLPNRGYYVQLRDNDAAKLEKNVGNVLLYALLELLSLVAMALLLRSKLRFSALRQLTFVLESQRQQVQSKLVLWAAFTLQSALDHFGVDYSFTFAW